MGLAQITIGSYISNDERLQLLEDIIMRRSEYETIPRKFRNENGKGK